MDAKTIILDILNGDLSLLDDEGTRDGFYYVLLNEYNLTFDEIDEALNELTA